jgi:hypothetical protein
MFHEGGHHAFPGKVFVTPDFVTPDKDLRDGS